MSVAEPIFADADHRLAALAVQAAFHDLGNIDDVVARGHRSARTASQPRERIGQLRQAMAVVDHGERREGILLPARGEGCEDLFVLVAENVDREKPAILENRAQRTVVTERDGYHRRLETSLLDEAAEHPDPPPLMHGADGVKPARNPPQGRFQAFLSA